MVLPKVGEMSKLFHLEARERETEKLVNRWEPMTEKRSYALLQLITMGGIKEGYYLQVVPEDDAT